MNLILTLILGIICIFIGTIMIIRLFGQSADRIAWNEQADVLLIFIDKQPVNYFNKVCIERKFDTLKSIEGVDRKRFKKLYATFLFKYKKYVESYE